MAPDGIVFALSNPDPEIHPDDRRQVCGRGGDRPQRLPEPDQQRAGVPRCVPRRAGRRRPPDHREDEGGCRRGDLRGRRRRPRRRPHRARARWTRGSGPPWPQAVAAAARASEPSDGRPSARRRADRAARRAALPVAATRRAPSIAVGAERRRESALLAHLYAAALRTYGSRRARRVGARPVDRAGLRRRRRRARFHRPAAGHVRARTRRRASAAQVYRDDGVGSARRRRRGRLRRSRRRTNPRSRSPSPPPTRGADGM